VLTALIAVFQLAKDWKAHSTHGRRIAVLVFILAFLGVSAYNTHSSAVKADAERNRADKQRQADLAEIGTLQTAVETASKAQADNTQRFSQKIADLQTEIRTEGLKKQAAALQKELAATQKALNPEKAKLEFTFASPEVLQTKKAVHITTARVVDGVVHVEFNILNLTTATAEDGEVTLIICDLCEFVKEPEKFSRIAGQRSTERIYYFQRILPELSVFTMSADIRVPNDIQTFQIGINYRCKTCIIPQVDKQRLPDENSGTVHLAR
jgi:hypothetical protein